MEENPTATSTLRGNLLKTYTDAWTVETLNITNTPVVIEDMLPTMGKNREVISVNLSITVMKLSPMKINYIVETASRDMKIKEFSLLMTNTLIANWNPKSSLMRTLITMSNIVENINIINLIV